MNRYRAQIDIDTYSSPIRWVVFKSEHDIGTPENRTDALKEIRKQYGRNKYYTDYEILKIECIKR